MRVWDINAPEYFRAAVYEKYVGKIWKLPTKSEQKLYPAYYQIDYPVFELADSATKKESVRSVWVQSALDNFGFLFAPFGAVGVAAKNADSLDYYKTGIFVGANGKHGDWYYFTADDGGINLDDHSYLATGVLSSFAGTRNYYGEDKVIPIYIELDDGERLQRALNRERLPENGRYAEMCRRFLSDAEDFSEDKIRALGISDESRFENDDLSSCAERIKAWILKSIR